MRLSPSCRIGLLFILSACSDAPHPNPPAVPQPPLVASQPVESLSPAIDTTPAPLDTTLGRCTVALEAHSPKQQEVIEALRASYGLEGDLIKRVGPSGTISKDEVYAHYRQGFGDQLARELTEYSWQAEIQEVRATDRALAVPDSVGVLELKSDRALVAWIPPTAFRRQWGAPRCMIDRLVREDGRWIIQGRER